MLWLTCVSCWQSAPGLHEVVRVCRPRQLAQGMHAPAHTEMVLQRRVDTEHRTSSLWGSKGWAPACSATDQSLQVGRSDNAAQESVSSDLRITFAEPEGASEAWAGLLLGEAAAGLADADLLAAFASAHVAGSVLSSC